MKFLTYFFITTVQIAYCVSQTKNHETGSRNSSDNTSLVEESAYSSVTADEVYSTIINVAFNPCFFENADAEDLEEDTLNFATNRRKSKSSSVQLNQQNVNNRSSALLLSDKTVERFSDHFLTCSRIGFEPGTFDFLLNGSLHIPRLSIVLDKSNFCQNDTTGVVFICDKWIQSNNISEAESQKPKPKTYDYLSGEFLNCSGHIAIEEGEYEARSNRSVYVALYDRVFDYSNYLIREDGKLYLCPTFFPKEKKFPESFEIVTVTGLSVSILFIAAYMVSFFFLPSLRNLPGYCLFSLCLSLQTAYICFLVRRVGLSQQGCEDLVLSIMYFFLAAFFWMNVLSFDVWRSLKMATSKLRLSSDSMMWKRFGLYSAYAWLSPLCIVIFGITFTKYGSSVKFLKLEFHHGLCWFAKKGALFVYMALPLIILMCLNVIFFSTSFLMITRASMNTTDNLATFWKRFFLFLRLGVIMGVAWIFGIIAAATNEPALFYMFVILNTLQGVFIFFSFALSEKTKKELKKKIRIRKASAGRTQVTSQQVQSMTSV